MKSPQEQFLARIGTLSSDGCWIWSEPLTSNGYGRFADTYAHRWSYENFIGAISSGLDIDHLCRTRACVNPLHLQPVSRRVNLLRGKTIPARNAAKTHCHRGHPLEDPNLYVYAGRRRCRACWSIDNRIAYSKRAVAANA